MLLPLALAARMIIKPRPAIVDVAQGVMRFCLGFGKWVLLVDPLWHLSAMVLRGGPESLNVSVARMGFFALLLSLFFIATAMGDLITGLGGMLGFRVSEKVQQAFTLRTFTSGKPLRLLVILLVLTLLGVLLQTLSVNDTWLHLKALFIPPAKTIAAAFQDARVWTDYHAITMFAALTCLIGLPHSRDFLKTAAPWKGTICLSVFMLALAMLWTQAAPMS